MAAKTGSSASSPAVEASIRHVDLAALLAALEALSNEITTGRLVETLTTIAVEHTGADRGLLILRDGTERRLEAIASASDGEVSVQRVGRPVSSSDLPMAVLLRAEQAADGVVLDDAIAPRDVPADETPRQAAPRSAMCVPLMMRGECVGAIYLENTSAPHAFTPAHRALLVLLSPQAAVSLRNAKTHETLQGEHAECRRSEAALRRSEERHVLDGTERKAQQEAMLRTEIRLRQAERFEAMGTLAGGIAHDFNNILGAILGFSERALLTAREGTQLHHDLSNVVTAGERGRTLVERILSFSRGTVGERVPVHVERVVHEALSLFRARLPANVTLRVRLQAGRAAILGDAVQIHQLLMNLVTNAAHAMTRTQAGTLSVTLAVADISRSRDARIGAVTAGSWIVLQVADQGRGMTPELMKRMFDPFFTTREAGVGTGLGLSLVLRIVTQYGGAIDVDSAPGSGSVFTVYLPRCGDGSLESPGAGMAAPRGQGQRVMVVDDEEGLLELTTHALGERGYEPVGFGSARVALEAFRERPDDFDLLLTDLRMPGMSGDVLIREVRSVRPLLPVILISGYLGDVVQGGYSSDLADVVLTKPLRVNVLAASVARVLGIG